MELVHLSSAKVGISGNIRGQRESRREFKGRKSMGAYPMTPPKMGPKRCTDHVCNSDTMAEIAPRMAECTPRCTPIANRRVLARV